MYTEDNEGHVILTLDHGDYSNLVLALGYAAGSALKDEEIGISHAFLQLANTINQGNPDWTPYSVASGEN